MNMLLASIYNTVGQVIGGRRNDPLLFHGCGIETRRGGYLFTGPSGAGKTTVARLAGSRPVLNDEAVLLRSERGEISVSGTPLLGGMSSRTRGWHRLQAVFMLKHADEPKLRRLRPVLAYTPFLTQLFDTAPLVPPGASREGISMLEARMDLASDAARGVPMYELQFRPDGSFWPLVERLRGE
jgi:hypothetical protein